MLRTTNKLVVERLRDHVIDNFKPENYGGGETMANLREQLKALQADERGAYPAAIDYVEGGSYLAYYHDVKKFLQETLEETDAEADRYSIEKMWRLYCHLVARTLSQLYGRGF